MKASFTNSIHWLKNDLIVPFKCRCLRLNLKQSIKVFKLDVKKELIWRQKTRNFHVCFVHELLAIRRSHNTWCQRSARF